MSWRRSLPTRWRAVLMALTVVGAALSPVTGQAAQPAATERSPQVLGRLLAAAEAGDRVAMGQVGEYHQFGWGGLAADEGAGLIWYRRAAEAGDGRGALRLGLYYGNGLGGLTRNRAEARRWFVKAAEAGEPWAMHQLATYYAQGWGGLSQDWSQSQVWRRRAAELGVGEAMRLLGQAYETGEGGLSVDLSLALDWYRRAQRAGDGRAGAEAARLERRARAPELACLAHINDALRDLKAQREVLDVLPGLPRYSGADLQARLAVVRAQIEAEMRVLTTARGAYAHLEPITDLDRYHIKQSPAETDEALRGRCLT